MLEENATSTHYVALSKIQAVAVADMISAANDLSNETKSELANIVIKMRWAEPAHCDLVLQRLVASDVERPAGAKRRRLQQDYKQIYLYLTGAMWDALKGSSSPDAKLSALLQHALRLGLRLPSEPTAKMIASIWQLTTCEDPGTIDNVTKAIRYQRVKDDFDALRRRAANPIMWVEKLPEDPLEFHHKFGPIWEICFSQAPPASPKIPVDVLVAFDNTYKCRGGLAVPATLSHSGFAIVPKQPLGVHAPSIQVGAPDLQNLGHMAMAMMQQVTTQQARLMEMLVGGGPVGGGPRPLSLASLHDRANLNRCAFALPPPAALPTALTDSAFVEEVESPPAAQPFRRLTSVLSPQPEQPMRPEALAIEAYAAEINHNSASGPAAASAPDDVEDILDMMQARKAVNATAKAAAKAAAVVAGAVVTAKGVNIPKQAAVASKAQTPSKAKAAAPKAQTVSKAKAAASKAEAASEAKVKAAAKSKGKNAEVETPPAPPPAKKAKLVLGCGRCRYGKNGCSSCRNPNFQGIRGNAANATK